MLFILFNSSSNLNEDSECFGFLETERGTHVVPVILSTLYFMIMFITVPQQEFALPPIMTTNVLILVMTRECGHDCHAGPLVFWDC